MPLAAGQVLERPIRGGETHRYVVTLAAGDYLDASLAPHGVTVIFRLSAPAGGAFEEHLPGGTGPKSIEWVADVPGEHHLDLRSTSVEARQGGYRLELKSLRPAQAADRDRFAARLALEEGESAAAQGQFAEALASYERALPLARAVGDPDLEGRILGKAGLAHRWLGDLSRATELLRKALERRRHSGPYAQADALVNLGGVSRDRRDYQAVLRHYLDALPLMRQAGARVNEAVVYQNLAAVYSDLGSYRDAIHALTMAAAIMEEEGLLERQASVYTSLGRVYWQLEDAEQALSHHRRALAIRQAGGNEKELAEVLADLGLTHEMLAKGREEAEHYRTAIEHLERALEMHTRLENHAGRRLALQALRRTYASRGAWEKALAYSRLALEVPGGPDWPEFAARARIALRRGRLDEARKWVDRAVASLEASRPVIQDDYLRASYEGSVNELFDLQVDVLMRLHERSPQAGLDWAAFQASEGGRARALLDSLAGSRAETDEAPAPALLEREQDLAGTAATLHSRLARVERETPAWAALQAELRGTLTELQESRARGRRRERHDVMARTTPPRLDEIQAILDESSLLLEYDLGRERSYGWAVTKRSWTSFRLPPQEEIDALARRLGELLSARAEVDTRRGAKAVQAALAAADREYEETAARLSDIVLGELRPSSEVSRLIFVWDGALHYVPVAALPFPARWGQGKGPAPGLISRFEVVTLPSVSVMSAVDRERQRRPRPPKEVAVFADPVFASDDERLSRDARRGAVGGTSAPAVSGRSPSQEAEREREALRLGGTTISGAGLARLRHTARLAEDVLREVPPERGLAALGFAATREAALDPGLADYRIVVFATHGLFDEEFPSLSGIALSSVDRHGNPQNGIVRQHDIYGATLNADLVMLAGCQTGVGREIRGEGLLGLSRAFFYAGASRVLASLWEVEEKATVELVADLLRRAEKDGKTYAAALREAQLRLARDPRRRSPYFWAGFALQGDWR